MGSTGCCGVNGLKAWSIVCALLAIGCFTVAIFVPRAIDRMLDDGINDSLVVNADSQRDGTKAYRLYVDPNEEDSTPMYYKAYMYHITNAAAVLGGAQPAVEEKGPYVYRKKTYKHDVTFDTNVFQQSLVSFRTQTQYVFVPEMSAGAESDVVTNLNLPFAGTKGPTQGQLYYAYGAPGPADAARFFSTHNVSDWLFGFPDPVLAQVARAYPGYISPRFAGLIGVNENAYVATNKLTVQFVGSEPDQALIRQYVQYEGQESLQTASFVPPSTVTYAPTWRSGRANRIGGTDGSIFQRNLQESQTVQAYVPQLARVVTLGNVDAAKLSIKGIDLLHFTLPAIFLGNSTAYPPNADFYMFQYSGVANMTAAGKADFFVSKPHFLDADDELRTRVTGLSAGTKDAHDTYLDVEPLTGVTMRAAKRMQLNVRITPVAANVPINATHTTPVVWGAGLPNQDKGQYVPVVWFEESAEISDKSADSFKKSVYGAKLASTIITIAGEAAGCLFVVLAIVFLWIASNKAVAVASGTDGPTGGSDNRVVPINDKLAPNSMPPPANANAEAGAGSSVAMTVNN